MLAIGKARVLSRSATAALRAAVCAIALSLPSGADASAADAHLFQQDQCIACHLFPEREGTFLRRAVMRRDVNTLCFTCHEAERTGVGHRVGMVASMPVPEDFPLDPEGRLTCATCHDPHALDGPHPDLLRRAPGRAFCELCHPDGFSPGAQPAVRLAFPPEGVVLPPGETVVAGTVSSRSLREVTVRTGRSVVAAPVVDGAFAAQVSLRAGAAGIAVEAGPDSTLFRVKVAGGREGWRPHLSADTRQCGLCHTGWERAGYFFADPPAETCYRCHGRLDRMPHTHRPVGLGECTVCHDPHGAPGARTPVPAESVCLRCHDRDAAARHILVANADLAAPATACPDCHDPHQSTRRAMTTSAPASLAVALELEAPEPAAGLGDGPVFLPGFRLTGDPGRPQLPERLLPVAVPPGADPRTARLRVVAADVAELPGRHRISPAPPAAAWVEGETLREWGRGRRVRDGEDVAVYGGNAPWPREAVSLEAPAEAGDLGIVRIAYRPLQYNPSTGVLTLTRRAHAEVSFAPRAGKRGLAGTGPARAAPALRGPSAAQLGLVNARRAEGWVATSAVPEGDGETTGLLEIAGGLGAPAQIAAPGGANAGYVIVTTRAIAGASAELAAFAAHKQSRGHSVRVVTEGDYGEDSGAARAHAVRAWLRANQAALGIRYVLLVGNPHPETGDLPMLRAWPRKGATTSTQYQDAPTDAYFADLTGEWDLDGDGYYGEFGDDGGPGGVDFVPEVFVGRIPVYGDVGALDAVLRKTVAYESEGGDLAWRRSVLLPMSFSDAATDGAWLAEEMKGGYLLSRGFTPWTLYQQGTAGGGNSVFASDEELRGGAAQTRWTASPPGVVAWWGHGSGTRTYVGYADAWDGDLLAAPVTALRDDSPSFVFQTACLNGYPELSVNLGWSLLQRGAIATVAASRVSWYYVGQKTFAGSASNAGIGYGYVARLTAGESAGSALALAKGDPALVTGSATIWMNIMDFNLYGDPGVALFRGPLLQVSQEGLEFTVVEGEEEPVVGAVTVSAAGPALGFEALPEAAWLAGAPLAGETPATVALTAQPAGLSLGQHAAQVLIVSEGAGNSPLALPVTLRVVRPARIAGSVTALGGGAVAGATVSLQGPRSRFTTTGADGGYAFDALPPGTYTVAVAGTGFVFSPAAAGVLLAEGDAATRGFAGGSLALSGRTLKANGAPLRGAVVQLRTLSGVLVRRFRTRADGSYVLAGVAPGEYRLRVRHRRWRFPVEPVTLVDAPVAGWDLVGRRRRR